MTGMARSSGLIPHQPLLGWWTLVRRHCIEQRTRGGLRDDHLAMSHRHEALTHSMIEHREHRVVIAIEVEHPARLVMQPELRPGQRLAELLERAETTRHCDE